MLAHSFSVSDPPRKPSPTVGKKELMRNTRQAALQFILDNINEWCLVGTYPVARSRNKRFAYNQAKYYRDRLEEYCAATLAYEADKFPLLWDLSFNKRKGQYEVRALCAYRPHWEYGNDIAESNAAAHYEMTGEKRQVNAVKQAMDSLFFGGQR